MLQKAKATDSEGGQRGKGSNDESIRLSVKAGDSEGGKSNQSRRVKAKKL